MQKACLPARCDESVIIYNLTVLRILNVTCYLEVILQKFKILFMYWLIFLLLLGSNLKTFPNNGFPKKIITMIPEISNVNQNKLFSLIILLHFFRGSAHVVVGCRDVAYVLPQESVYIQEIFHSKRCRDLIVTAYHTDKRSNDLFENIELIIFVWIV